MNIEQQLRRDEGFSQVPYQDTEGRWTVGIGWNISDNGIPPFAGHELMNGRLSDETIDRLLQKGIAEARETANKFIGFHPRPRSLNTARLDAVTNMAFNLGHHRLHGFKRMQAAIKADDWQTAADEALDSKWARQVGDRAVRIATTLVTGVAQ